MKTAEEILRSNLISGGMFMKVKDVEAMIIAAMEEYAKQKVTPQNK